MKTLCIKFFSEYLSNNNYCHRNVPSFLSILLEISSSRISLRSSSRIMLFRLWQQETNHRIQWFMYFLVRTSDTIIIMACLARATWLCIIFLSQRLWLFVLVLSVFWSCQSNIFKLFEDFWKCPKEFQSLEYKIALSPIWASDLPFCDKQMLWFTWTTLFLQLKLGHFKGWITVQLSNLGVRGIKLNHRYELAGGQRFRLTEHWCHTCIGMQRMRKQVFLCGYISHFQSSTTQTLRLFIF